MSQSNGLIEIKVRQMLAGGMVEGLIHVPVESVDWFGRIDERDIVCVRGEKFTLKDIAGFSEDMKAARGGA